VQRPGTCILKVTQHVKGSPCSIAERRVPQLIPVLGSQPTGDVSHKPGGRLPLLSARPTVRQDKLLKPGLPRLFLFPTARKLKHGIRCEYRRVLVFAVS